MDDTQRAIEVYNNDSFAINEQLMLGFDIDDPGMGRICQNTLQLINTLKSAMKVNVLQTSLFRGMPVDVFQYNNVVKFKQFLSTTTDRKVAERFAESGGIVYIITHIEVGIKSIVINGNESEVLFENGLYMVLDPNNAKHNKHAIKYVTLKTLKTLDLDSVTDEELSDAVEAAKEFCQAFDKKRSDC